jgi:hypothetical protein
VPLSQAMYSTTARFAPAPVGQAKVSMSSPLSEEKKLSASAVHADERGRDCSEARDRCAVPGAAASGRRPVSRPLRRTPWHAATGLAVALCDWKD